MTRFTIRDILLNSGSHGAQEYRLFPPVCALDVEGYGQPSVRIASEAGTLSFIRRVHLWLKLVFGLCGQGCAVTSRPGSHLTMARQKRRAFSHRAKRRANARKAPAHDLEMLMSFVPSARGGLTLNQYRERLGRISVLGRAQIYHRFLTHRVSRSRILRLRARLRSSMGAGCPALCSAPLSPD